MGFGENLIKLRNTQDISRKELAEKLGVPYTTLRNYETGQREPGHKLLIKLSEIFSVSVDYLISSNTQEHLRRGVLSTNNALNEDEQRLVDYFRKLNGEGQEKLVEYADDMVQSGKYKKLGELCLDIEA